ncbi:MAG: extracellular solute-binding protein [Ruminococcaceae bacterium]|nr:extracellular solute-binding protein [Oscillospiraceae bacterium]
MKRTRLTRLIAAMLSLLMLVGCFSFTTAAEDTEAEEKVMSYDIEEVKALLNALTYTEYTSRNARHPKATSTVVVNAVDFDTEHTDAAVRVVTDYEGDKGEALFLPTDGTVSWNVSFPETGKYAVKLYYASTGNQKSTSIERACRIDGEFPFKGLRYLTITKNWNPVIFDATTAQSETENGLRIAEDGSFRFQTDINGNDIKPNLVETSRWAEYSLSDSTGYDVYPYEIVFTEGEHRFSLEASRDEMVLKKIEFYPLVETKTYEQVLAEYEAKGYKSATAEPIKIEAEFPVASSDRTIYPQNDRSSAITSPQDPSKTKMNAIGGTKWQSVGQWIEYKFTCEESGLYYIATRFKQSDLAGIYVTRRLYINDEIPFDEANYCQFNYSGDWQAAPLNNGETNFQFYFEEGKEYTIKLEVALGHVGDILELASNSMSSMNADYLKILQITGSDPDEYRDYNFNVLIPNIIKDLYEQSQILTSISKTLVEISGEKSSNSATLDNISRTLYKMATDEDEVARNLATMKSYIGTLGTWINSSQNQPLLLDYISICPVNAEDALPRANASFFESLKYEVLSFISSFRTDYSNLGATREINEDEVLEVWISGGRDQAQIVRNLVDNKFTNETNIGVNLKLIAAGTLLPATLSGAGPDISLTNAQGDPIQYAIRNAVTKLNDFDTFDEVTSRFDEAAMIPLTLYGDTYGLPETMTFSMMFYRKDVFADLGLDIPRTWDELMALIPILQYNNMEAGIPASTAGLNLLLYQMGGEVYADEGMRIGYDSNIALEAFDKLCSYFTNYGFPVTYDFANRFRTGELPLGFSDYVASYNQLTIFATEIRGLWEFVPLLGYENADGTINNDSLVTVAPMMMMAGVKDPEKAWDFMDWFVTADIQAAYANEVVATIGQGAMYATANKEALESLPWATSDYNNIMEQIKSLSSVPEYPGGYILARYTNFAFLDAYNNDADPVESLLGYVDDINKEITRKREEFDLETLELGETLAEKRAREAAQAEKE